MGGPARPPKFRSSRNCRCRRHPFSTQFMRPPGIRCRSEGKRERERERERERGKEESEEKRDREIDTYIHTYIHRLREREREREGGREGGRVTFKEEQVILEAEEGAVGGI